MRRSYLILVTATLATLAACGGVEPASTNPSKGTPSWKNREPTIIVASPSEMAIGDRMTIVGRDFIDPKYGQAVLLFRGAYFGEDGKRHKVNYQTKAKFTNTTKLYWEMRPNIVFHPNGDKRGRFVGELVVLNVAKDGSRKASQPQPLSITVKPSILPRVITPLDGGCTNKVVRHTLQDTDMSLRVEALGLRPGTKETPLVFYWSFLSQQWKVTTDYGSFDPTSVFPKKGSVVVIDKVTNGRSSTLSGKGKTRMLFKVASDVVGFAGIKELRTEKVPSDGNNMPVTVNVAAVDASGKSASIALKLTVHRQADMHYDGTDRLAERFQPVLVSDCIPGGDIGRDVSYAESSVESRHRSVGYSYNAETALTLGLPSNPFALGLHLSQGFGVNVNAAISTDKSKSLNLTGQIHPGEYGVFYRQTVKVYRIAKLTGWTKCGSEVNLGQVRLTDWKFAPDLAKGEKCVPPSNLPPARKVLDLD